VSVVHFYVTGLVFIVFDLGVVLLYLWRCTIGNVGTYYSPSNILIGMEFIRELIAGYSFALVAGVFDI
jgi:NADH:ubiquinone oxidoreductase subunit 3 (subunit A)